jgi:ribose/xylose/arabinose/galactoside ABC-type transport system permease subunit
MGLAYLVLVGLTLLILAARSAAPAHENAGEQLRQATNGTEDLGLCVGVLLGATAFYTAIAALGLVLGSLSFREWIGAIGASAVMVFAIGIPALWSELVPALRAMTRPRRPCPRCGLSVPAGEMKCPHCEFDFWKVGA